MTQTLISKDVDVRYYYNRKSKYFEDLEQKNNSTGRATVQQFLKYLTLAYSSNKPNQGDDFDIYINNSSDWLRITRISHFAELLDIEESCLYSVMNERDDLRDMKINNTYELFNYCDYLLNIPSQTNVTLYSDSSNESVTSFAEESIFEIEDKLQDETTVSTCIPPSTASKQITANVLSKDKPNLKKSKPSKLGYQQLLYGSSVDKSQLNNLCSLNTNDKLEHIVELKDVALANDEPSKVATKTNTSDNFRPFTKDPFNMFSGDVKQTVREHILTIHVKDNVKKVTKDFQCSEKLLVSKMGYFAGKHLDNADINIQCNLIIFNWIMEWVTMSNIEGGTSGNAVFTATNSPLNPKNAIQVLICVSYLRIEELINICLCYCKSNMNEVLKSARNFSCLNNSILERFADMYSNVEVETLYDKKDKIKSYLYCKLISSLSLPEPEPWKGHFSSLADVFRCGHCKKLVMNKIVENIPCLTRNICLNLKGEISVVHVKDQDWNLTEYIASLKTKLKSWRKVYWRLWAECHFLYCTTCKSYYSVYYCNRCFYHLDEPQFSADQTASAVTGRYPCCRAKAYKYQCVVHRTKGCRVRNHTPILRNNRASTDIMKLYVRFQRFIYANSPDDYISLDNIEHPTNLIALQNQKLKTSNSLLNAENAEVQWKLPYFIPEQKKAGCLLQRLVKTKLNSDAKIYPSWIINKKFQGITGTSKSVELLNNMNERNPKRTLVGLFMQQEDKNIKNDYDTATDTSFSSSDNENDEESQSDDESDGSIFDNCYAVNSDSSFYQQNSWKTNSRYKKKMDRYIKSQKRTTRINQDNQRESEENNFALASSILSHKTHHKNSFLSFNNKMINNLYRKMILSTNDIHSSSCSSNSTISITSSTSTFSGIGRSRKAAVWWSHTPLAGTYRRVESEWTSTKKYFTNLLTNKQSTILQPVKHLKPCFHCYDQNQNICKTSSLKQKSELPLMKFRNDTEQMLWINDSRHQQLDNITAVCKPVSLWKEFKSDRSHVTIDWNNVITLERKWNTFLQLFDQNEVFPVDDGNHKTKLKSQNVHKLQSVHNITVEQNDGLPNNKR